MNFFEKNKLSDIQKNTMNILESLVRFLNIPGVKEAKK